MRWLLLLLSTAIKDIELAVGQTAAQSIMRLVAPWVLLAQKDLSPSEAYYGQLLMLRTRITGLPCRHFSSSRSGCRCKAPG